MWALPARSIPGSEMLLVEKTRMRGTKVRSASIGLSGASVVIAGCSFGDRRLPALLSYFWRTTNVRS